LAPIPRSEDRIVDLSPQFAAGSSQIQKIAVLYGAVFANLFRPSPAVSVHPHIRQLCLLTLSLFTFKGQFLNEFTNPPSIVRLSSEFPAELSADETWSTGLFSRLHGGSIQQPLLGLVLTLATVLLIISVLR
jgi:hypothetical protein